MTESGHMQLILTITGSHGCTNSSEDEEEGADELRHQSPDAVRLRRLLPAAKCNLCHSSLLSPKNSAIFPTNSLVTAR